MSRQAKQFLSENDFYGRSYDWRGFKARNAAAARASSEQHNARVANMSDTEKAVIQTATAVRSKMAERYQTWSDAGLLSRWVIGRNTKVLPLEHGVDAVESRLTMSVHVPVEGDESDWLLQLSSRPYTKKGRSTRLAFAHYHFSDLQILQTEGLGLSETPVPLPHFEVRLSRQHIIDRHDLTESNNSLWPTPERAEQLHGILKIALPQV